MEIKNFKKILNDDLSLNGFSKQGSYYYRSNKDILFIIGLQKSNFSNSYYINLGLILKELTLHIDKPRDVDSDIRARFTIEQHGKKTDLFDLEALTEIALRRGVEDNINTYIEPIKSVQDLKYLIESRPVMLYQTKLKAKQFLGF
jgi:hypothetical protein